MTRCERVELAAVPRDAFGCVVSSDARGRRTASRNKKNAPRMAGRFAVSGGGGGIRTLVTGVTGETVFETAAFNHSATPPLGVMRRPGTP